MTESARPTPSPVLAGAALMLALAAGCGSPAPAPRYHTLLPAPDGLPEAVAPAAPGWDALGVSVPPQVDRPQWVVRAADGALAVLEDELWAAPLAEEIVAAIAERLRRAAPATSVPKGRKPWRVTVEIQRFESQPQRAARIEAEWSLRPAEAGAATWRCRGVFERPVAGGYPALAAAHREALVALGDAVAKSLAAALAGAGAPACGA